MHGIVVIGTSLGGLTALRVVLRDVGSEFPLPIAIVQHRGKAADDALLWALQQACSLPVSEPADKDEVLANHVYVAPADYHLLVDRDAFALSTEAPVCQARPSIDVLFESAAKRHGRDTIGVILTGSNEDGARGSAAVKAQGGIVLVQDPDTAESKAMPTAAAAFASRTLPLSEIGPQLAEVCRTQRRPAR